MGLVPSGDRMSDEAFVQNIGRILGNNSALTKKARQLVNRLKEKKQPTQQQKAQFPKKKNGGWWEFSNGEKQRGMSEDEAREYESGL